MGLKPNGVKGGAAEKLREHHQSSRGYILQAGGWTLGRMWLFGVERRQRKLFINIKLILINKISYY
jgi:very-short-patch-repair endonuclease